MTFAAHDSIPIGTTLAYTRFFFLRPDVLDDKVASARMTRAFHHETNPFNSKRITQDYGDRTVRIVDGALETAAAGAVGSCPRRARAGRRDTGSRPDRSSVGCSGVEDHAGEESVCRPSRPA